jgi:hypothetical protein
MVDQTDVIVAYERYEHRTIAPNTSVRWRRVNRVEEIHRLQEFIDRTRSIVVRIYLLPAVEKWLTPLLATKTPRKALARK